MDYQQMLNEVNNRQIECVKWHETLHDLEQMLLFEKEKMVRAGFKVELHINDIISEMLKKEPGDETYGVLGNSKEYILFYIDHEKLNKQIDMSLGLCDTSPIYPALFVRTRNRFIKTRYIINTNIYKICNGGFEGAEYKTLAWNKETPIIHNPNELTMLLCKALLCQGVELDNIRIHFSTTIHNCLESHADAKE